MIELQGARVLVTGASGGIGRAVARALAGRGARVLLTARRGPMLEALAAELGGEALSIDLADRSAVADALAAVGEVDVLVANAALPASGRLDSFGEDEIDRALDVNLRAPMVLARALVPEMVRRGGGHVVLVSSLSGKAAAGGTSVYAATKFALRGFGLALRDELRGTGVGVSVVSPGFVRDAGMFADAQVPLPRWVGTRSPEQVADAVVQAIVDDRAEVDVAPLGLRLGTALAGLAPEAAATVQRRLGGAQVAERLAAGQRHKR